MVHESLFSSEQLSELPIEIRYLYIATIVHSDDAGRMRADAKYLKLKAFPFDPIRTEDILAWRDKLATIGGLLVVYEVGGREYLFHPKWEKWQTLRKDRMKPTDCPDPGNQMSTNGKPMVTKCRHKEVKEVKEVTEPNLSEGKVTSSIAGFGASPPPALKSFEEAGENEVCAPPKGLLKKLAGKKK